MTSEFFQRHKAGILLMAMALLSLFFLTNRVDPTVRGVKTAVYFLVNPTIVYSGEFFNKVDSLSGRLFRLVRAEGENHILREQNARLSKEALERDALQRENDRLRNLLDLRIKIYPEAIPAEVLAHDVRDWFYSFILNKGSKDGIVKSAAVVTGSASAPALVGRIVEVTDRTSKVLLITDPVSAVSVAVRSSGALGLLEGRNRPQVLVRYLSNRSHVLPGDEIITVGLGGVFPPGVPVGRVRKVMPTPDGFFKEALVIPYLDFASIQQVLVLKRTEAPAIEETK